MAGWSPHPSTLVKRASVTRKRRLTSCLRAVWPVLGAVLIALTARYQLPEETVVVYDSVWKR